MALDINPLLNPYMGKDGSVAPVGAVYNQSVRGTILASSEVVRLFEALGWKWGGRWETPIDYQHFEKEV
jgi:hypothetical protein